MAFDERTIGELLSAKKTATNMLMQEGHMGRLLSLHESMVIQAASHLLLSEATFYGRQIVDLTDLSEMTTSNIISRFEDKGIVERQGVLHELGIGRPPNLYGATKLGTRTMRNFQDPLE